MEIFDFLYSVFIRIWQILFSTNTLFGVSFGVILLGVSLATVLWNVVMLALGISSSDFSSLGTPRDYYKKRKKEKEAYSRAEQRFRDKHHGKLVDYNG